MILRFVRIVRDVFIIGGVRIALLYMAALFIVAAPAATIRLSNYSNLKNDLTSLTLAQRQDLVESSRDGLANHLDKITQYAKDLAVQPKIHDDVVAGKWQQAIDLIDLDQQVHGDSYIDHTFLADAAGSVKADLPVPSSAVGTDISTQPWYAPVIASGQTVLAPVYRRTSEPQLNVVSISSPITGADNRIVGMIVTQMSIEHFGTWVRALDTSDGKSIAVIDQQGQLVADSGTTLGDEIAKATPSVAINDALSGRTGAKVIGATPAAQNVVAYAPVEPYGWALTITQPYKQATISQSRTLRQFIGLELLGSVWNLIILLGLILIIHRLVQYLFAEETIRHSSTTAPTAMTKQGSVQNKK